MATTSTTSSSSSPAPDDIDNPSRPIIPRSPTLLHPPRHPRHTDRPTRLRLFRSLCRSLPLFSTSHCRLPLPHDPTASSPSRSRLTGTLFGHLRGRVTLSLQESPSTLPWVVLEMAVQTQVLMREMGSGAVRIALECERGSLGGAARRVMDEGMWGVFYNGRKSGYAVRREATEDDLAVMELLRAVSMGAGVLPVPAAMAVAGAGGGEQGEVAYLRAFFEHVAGSRDSESLYLVNPDDKNGPELTIFFVRV